jgi:hypothetical protein
MSRQYCHKCDRIAYVEGIRSAPRKAISYHDDPALAELPQDVRRDLVKAVKETSPQELLVLKAIRARDPTP